MFKWNKKEEKRFNRTTVIVTEVCVAIVVLLSALGIKYLVTNRTDKAIHLSDQVVENLTFSEFTIAKGKNNSSSINVNIINYTEESITFKTVTVNLYASDNTKVASLTFGTEEEPIKLEPNQETTIEGTSSIDLSDVTFVEYEIKK